MGKREVIKEASNPELQQILDKAESETDGWTWSDRTRIENEIAYRKRKRTGRKNALDHLREAGGNMDKAFSSMDADVIMRQVRRDRR